jgi:hypothetical protein
VCTTEVFVWTMLGCRSPTPVMVAATDASHG